MRVLSRAHLAVTALFAAALMLASMPATAHATYADVADKYSASQELSGCGDIVYAEDIPNGTYNVPAMTTSYMCVMTNPNTGERDSCSITVNNGNITATFYLSKAYNAIFFGSAEAAAASTNADGTDGSAYIFGDPPTGYVPHLFSITVPALNYPFEMATFNGGNNTHDMACWYSRSAVVKSSPEIEEAIRNKQQEDEPADDTPVTPTPGGNSSSSGSSGGSSGYAGGSMDGSQGSDGSGSAAPMQQATSQLRGIELTIVSLDDSESQGSAGAAAAAEESWLTPQLLIAIVLGLTLLAGIAWRTIGFINGKRAKAA